MHDSLVIGTFHYDAKKRCLPLEFAVFFRIRICQIVCNFFVEKYLVCGVDLFIYELSTVP